MNVRIVLVLLLTWSGVPGSGVAMARDGLPSRPNILFIYADDHSPKTVSCYEDAYPMAHTPNIDRLAASGVRFRAAYLGSWCMPSRASLLTGVHPHSIESMRMTGSNPRSAYDPEQCPFWPAVFRQHGYQTAQIGKWHTGTDSGWGRDWDYQRVWNRPDNPDNAGRYYGPQVIDFNGQRRMVDGYATDNYTDWACDYIRGEGRDPDRPWYLWLCYGAIHTPTTPADRHQGLLKEQTAELPPGIFGPRPGKPSYLQKTQVWEPTDDGGAVFRRGKLTHTAWMQRVHECLMAVDEGVGRLLETLRETGQLENTLVVYSSDQGYANGEHGMRQKVAPYEATYSSPFIVSMPGSLPAGKFCRHTVNAPDVIVTFFSLAGLELPWKMHGRDFTPLLLDPDNAPWERPTLYTHVGQDYGSNVTRAIAAEKEAVHANVPYYAALRHEDIKYVRYLTGSESEELYDLKADPDELTNLARDPRYRDSLEKYRALWLHEMQMADAAYLEHLPPLPEPEKMHLFLLVGQSNMAGRGELEAQDRIPHPRVFMLDKDGQWRPAVDPLHFDKRVAGVGLGKTFGQVVAETLPEVVVGLIPCAVGGSPIDAWKPGEFYPPTQSHPWDDAIRRASIALKSGEWKGILWHQGESDSNSELAPAYQAKLDDLVQRFRDELAVPDVPFIVGQLGQFAQRPWNEFKRQVDRAHRELPQRVPHTAVVGSEGLQHQGDQVHFDAESYRELGRRYADAYLKLIGR